MTALHQPDILAARDELVAPPPPRACEDRSFELPTSLYVAMALMFIGFVSVLAFAFRGPSLAIPYAIFVFFISAFFVVPGLWAGMNPEESRTKALDWYRFRERGIATATGRTPAAEAATLVLLLPFLILCWAVSVAIIAALV